MDYALQKAVELGVTEITPLITERCVIQLDEKRTTKRLRHWQGIVQGACEQCGRNRLPELHSPTQLSDHLKQTLTGANFSLDPNAQVSLSSLEKPDSDLCLLIGPEGGFSGHKRKQALQANYTGINLGPRILRTKTAVLASITAMQTLWGDMGN